MRLWILLIRLYEYSYQHRKTIFTKVIGFFVKVSIVRHVRESRNLKKKKRGGAKVEVKIINKAIVNVPFIWIALSSAFLNIFFLFVCVIT